VSGFKVQNANFEGILVTNASGVTISGNQVLKNNVNLDVNAGVCTGIPPFETNEDFDCGEGIHLSGVDHSIVADNVIENNSGGILLSDDTGATHDNLIMGNTVRNNPFDCGITLASHTLFGAPEPPMRLESFTIRSTAMCPTITGVGRLGRAQAWVSLLRPPGTRRMGMLW
jgi:parallel beta-helix repeat protein